MALVEKQENTVAIKYSLLLRLICVFALTYYGMSALLLFVALIFTNFIAGLSAQYLPELDFGRFQVFVLLLVGFLLNLGAVAGNLQVLRKKMDGVTLYALSAALIIIYQYVLTGPLGWQKYVLELGLLLFFLLILPISVKKMQPKDA